ncbi:MAG: UDPGP type 1 family protein [Lachnospiraceae bacterium]|nr:UDPGP type 1 family protein [Lachnospiraceae bacterium]
MTKEQAMKVLEEHNQTHVMRGFDDLTSAQQETLLNQIADLQWDDIALAGNQTEIPLGEITPIEGMDVEEIDAKREEYAKIGYEAIKEGKVAALLLAGGMGTRLGFDKPKGELNVGIDKTLYIFQCLINNLMDVTNVAGKTVPLYIMTSEKNNDETIRFFEEQNYFGYPKEDVAFFVQEMAAAVDYDGKLLMEEPGRLATSPNGNGGWFSSLQKAGLLEDVHKRGVEWINIFAVDNVLQRICDPAFIGATIESGKVSGSKVVRKVDPYEKMGVMCLEDGKPSVVEYYELSQDMAEATNPDGKLTYAYGVILNYIFRVDKLEEIVEKHLPVHVVEKKIPYITETGELVKPTEPNGYKFETLVVDMIRLMDDNLPFEVVREKEFAPIKNLHGVDSLDSARELLQANGVEL